MKFIFFTVYARKTTFKTAAKRSHKNLELIKSLWITILTW